MPEPTHPIASDYHDLLEEIAEGRIEAERVGPKRSGASLDLDPDDESDSSWVSDWWHEPENER